MIRMFILAGAFLAAAPFAAAQDGPGGCDSSGRCYNGARLNPGAAERDYRDNRDNDRGWYRDDGYGYDYRYNGGDWCQGCRPVFPNYPPPVYYPPPQPSYYEPQPYYQQPYYPPPPQHYIPRNYCMQDAWGRYNNCRRADTEDVALALIALGFIMLID